MGENKSSALVFKTAVICVHIKCILFLDLNHIVESINVLIKSSLHTWYLLPWWAGRRILQPLVVNTVIKRWYIYYKRIARLCFARAVGEKSFSN
jgi:hypothetical protein